MITDPQGTIIALFLAICRIGACFMTMPGFSSSRISPQIRMLLCVAVSMALLPVLWDTIYPKVSGSSQGTVVGLIFTEILIGAMYGLIARFYTLGFQFTGALIARPSDLVPRAARMSSKTYRKTRYRTSSPLAVFWCCSCWISITSS